MPVPIVQYEEPRQDWFTPAVNTGLKVFDTIVDYGVKGSQRDAFKAQAAKDQADTLLKGNQATAQGQLPAAFETMRNYQMGQDPSGYGSALSNMYIGSGDSNASNLASMFDTFNRGRERQEAIQMYPEAPMQAAFQANVANDLAAPDQYTITGNYGYNPTDPYSDVTMFPGAAKDNKPVKVNIDGKPTMAVWDGTQYTPVAGATPFNEQSGPKIPTGYGATGELDEDGLPVIKELSGGAGKTPEQSGKIGMIVQGRNDLEKAKAMMTNPDGTINLDLSGPVGTMEAGNLLGFAGLPKTQGRQLYSYMFNAIEGKLRIESGAAVPDSEVERMIGRFIPSVMDTQEGAQEKINRLGQFMDMSLEAIYDGNIPAWANPASPDYIPNRNETYGGKSFDTSSSNPRRNRNARNQPSVTQEFSGGGEAVDISNMTPVQIEALPPGTRVIQNGRAGVTE